MSTARPAVSRGHVMSPPPPSIEATAEAAAKAVAAVAAATGTLASAAGREEASHTVPSDITRVDAMYGGAEPKQLTMSSSPLPLAPRDEFHVSMPNLLEFPPRLEHFPTSVRSALLYLASSELELPPFREGRDEPLLARRRHPHVLGGERPLLTLVLDLDETLVHCCLDERQAPRPNFCVSFEETTALGYVYVRPFAELFLQVAARLFEVVVFTASSSSYADQVLDRLDPTGQLLSKRLYREHCVEVGGAYFKDMRRLGRPLSEVVLVDNSPVSLASNPDNGIIVQSWAAEYCEDRELLDLLLILQKCVHSPSLTDFLKNRYGLGQFFDDLRLNPHLIGIH
eukprot:TRINITY_DN30590_c0_g1_i1.p1 TRINITY_DN30590_c0_g1~~TRINITY_DN30590_c0_g1_i1.p1  ORF type:complete len:341 (-),score=81.89 TRINITY_DN30590_c0_g1_i1:51-1073(-)